MWKFQDFSATHILCELNFEECKKSKSGIFCNIRGSEFLNWGKFQPSKNCKNLLELKIFTASKCVEISIFRPLKSLKLISRKIWVAGTFWNFHNVFHVNITKCAFLCHIKMVVGRGMFIGLDYCAAIFGFIKAHWPVYELLQQSVKIIDSLANCIHESY